MKQASEVRFEPVEVGSTVLVPIPDVDRGKAEFRNVKAFVLEVNEGLYKVFPLKCVGFALLFSWGHRKDL